MAAITRQVGSTGQIVGVFVPDATVSTGVGLPNLTASTVSLSWKRSNMSAVSTQTLSTGTIGTWAASTFTQWSSTLALGWYDVSIPDGVFASGSTAGLHLYGGANMAPVPILVELSAAGFDNQRAISTQAATMPVVNTDKAGYGVSSMSIPVGVSSGSISVSTVLDKSGYGVSSLSIPVGVSSIGVTVGVSTMLDKIGYALTAAYDPAKTAAQAGDAMTLQSGERNSVADALLNRNVSGGSSTGRLVKQAYHVLRNKVDTGAGIVYDTDDTTSSFAFTVSTAAGNPITVFDPA